MVAAASGIHEQMGYPASSSSRPLENQNRITMGILVENLSKGFGAAPVVDGVSFEAPKGEVTTLLGPSGSGKSTILRLIAGLELPDGGAIRLGGDDITNWPVQKRNCGVVFQQYALFKHMTVAENIGFGLKVRGKSRDEIETRVAELLRLVQLEPWAKRLPPQLSGGQKQRVALARALAPRPEVLLLDEPFGALDAKVRAELRTWLLRLHEEIPVTTLLVTHDQEEAMELSDRVVVLHEGRVEQAGSPDEIYDRPQTPFVASFVGSPNVLHGEVRGGLASLGSLRVAVGVEAGEGQTVRAFIRPQDVSLAPERPRTGQAATAAGQAATPGAVAATTVDVEVTAAVGASTAQVGTTGDAVASAGTEDPVASGRVVRLVRIGWAVKVHLELVDGQSLVVQLSKEQVEEMALQVDDRVLVNLKEAKVFVQDYAI